VIFRDRSDLPSAQARFKGAEAVVVEEMLDIVSNPCLNFAVDPSGAVQFLGAADQIIGDAGNYIGNLFDLDQSLSGDMVAPALAVVERAAAMGYRGIAGIDMARTRDGRTLVLDLNFRINSCTPALLLAPELRKRGVRFMRLVSGRHPAGAAAAARHLKPLVARGSVIPLRLFDPEAAGLGGGDANAHLLFTGASVEDVRNTWAELGRSFALPEIEN
jgi:hypothetical protein